MGEYLNRIMVNHNLSSENSDQYDFNTNIIEQYGGDSTNKTDILKNIPTGSFPPLFVITQEEKNEKLNRDKIKERSFSTIKTAVSIKDIMKDRRGDDNIF
jgi:hypothetical protein